MESTRHGGVSLSKKPWFPPGTFQLRVRSISSLVLFNPPSSSSSVTLDIYDWEENLLWSSPSLNASPQNPAAPLHLNITENSIVYPHSSFIISLSSTQDSKEKLCNFPIRNMNALPSLGPNLPEQLPESMPTLLIGIGGNVYLSTTKDTQETTKILQFPAPYSASSYSLSLLLKYRRHHRALQQREMDNQSLKATVGSEQRVNLIYLLQQELADQGLDPYNSRIQDPDSSLSLRQRIFTSNPSKKTPFERKSELLISSKIEYLRCQLDLLKSEKHRLSQKNASVKKDINQLSEDIRTKKEVIQRLSQDIESIKKSLNAWSNQCQQSVKDFQLLDSHIKQTRLHLVNSINDLFPISIEGNIPTIRWVSLPNLSSLSRPFLKQDTLNVVSIVLGWIAHIVVLISRCLDIPLRYPIRTSGSVFAIRNDVCKIQEDDLRDFPLSARSVDLNRCEYGIYLLNKNICYLRWSCGLPPGDVRKILHNVVDLYKLGLKNSFKSLKRAELEALEQQGVLSPPWSTNRKFNNNSSVARDLS